MADKPTIEDQIAEVERELHLRAAIYPKWGEEKRYDRDVLDRQMLRLQAVRRTLIFIRDHRDRVLAYIEGGADAEQG